MEFWVLPPSSLGKPPWGFNGWGDDFPRMSQGGRGCIWTGVIVVFGAEKGVFGGIEMRISGGVHFVKYTFLNVVFQQNTRCIWEMKYTHI